MRRSRDRGKVPDKCYQKDPEIVSRRISDEYILVTIRHNVGDLESIYTLNEVAARTWELIDGKKKLSRIRDSIVEEFDISSQEAEIDLKEFLHKLEKNGIIKEV